MKKLKVATILGTRPELIRLSVIISKCDQFFEHSLIHTGQNFDFELNEIFFKDLSLKKPDYFLNSAKDNFAETLLRLSSILDSCGQLCDFSIIPKPLPEFVEADVNPTSIGLPFTSLTQLSLIITFHAKDEPSQSS